MDLSECIVFVEAAADVGHVFVFQYEFFEVLFRIVFDYFDLWSFESLFFFHFEYARLIKFRCWNAVVILCRILAGFFE